MAKLIRVDRNGTKYYEGLVPCDRCEGKGIYIIGVCNGRPVPSYVDNGVCFKCGGTGTVAGKWKEYTPEYEAKLAERRRKRAEKYQREHEQEIREREEARAKEEAERKAELERLEAEEKAEKAKSQYYGDVGDKVELKAIYKFSAWYETTAYVGFGTQTNYIHNFKAGDNTLVWKTTKPLGLEKETEITLKGTVKDHNIYKDEKQTVLTRCKVS